MKNRESFRQAVLVIEEIGMVDIRPFNMSGSPVGDGPDVCRERLRITVAEAFMPLPQSFPHDLRYRLQCPWRLPVPVGAFPDR